MDFAVLLTGPGLMALISLTILEIVLGVDNIIFISIAAGKLDDKEQKKAINWGLVIAMVMRIGLLFGITWITGMNEALFTIGSEDSWIYAGVTGQSLILLGGGLFLLWKSTKEIHDKVDHKGEHEAAAKAKGKSTLSNAIVQIIIINVVFSFDSILTAVGMTNGVEGALLIMIVSIVLSVGVMMLFAKPVGDFVNKHPSLQILALTFLILIGFMLILEAAHLSHAEIFDTKISAVPKGYLYFAIAFSLTVEFLNLKMRKNKKRKK